MHARAQAKQRIPPVLLQLEDPDEARRAAMATTGTALSTVQVCLLVRPSLYLFWCDARACMLSKHECHRYASGVCVVHVSLVLNSFP
jgi:hypothetical protein